MATIEHRADGPRRTHRSLVLTALVVAMFLAAIEGTIVATAMPSIASQLGGFSLYSWVFSSYLLMQAVTTPIFGKLADLYGRKPIFIAGVTIFLTGSLLCGFAESMGMLVLFRFVQGIGAGAVLPMSATLAGDLYSIQERGRIQGYLASVWGISSIIGPLTGGVIVENIDWHWIFWLNIPFGVISIALISLFLHESVQHRERSVDYTGTALLLLGLSALMLALTQAGEWGGGLTLALASVATLTMIMFVRQQRSAPDPIMHFELWSNPIIRRANLAILFAGVSMIGLITFLPTFVQGVLGGSPVAAGFTLSGMSLGWPIASVFAGRMFLRLGVRNLARAGGVLVTLGGFLVALLAVHGAVQAAIGAFLMGMGLGLLNTTYIVAIQTSVNWQQRGVATATNMLMRNLGNAVGAALLGGVLNARLAAYIDARGLSSVISLDSVRQLIQHGTGVAGSATDVAGSATDMAGSATDMAGSAAGMAGSAAGMAGSATGEALMVLRDGLSASLLLVFWAVAVVAGVVLLISWRVPDLHPDRIAEHERMRG